jgi:hypothetical protein
MRHLAAALAALALGNGALADDTAAPPDELLLKDGSRVFGSVTGIREDSVTIDTAFAGTLTIPLEQIESMSAEEDVTLLLDDESVFADTEMSIESGELVIADAIDPLPVDSLDVLNPEPWELGQGYNWTGLVNFALVLERGNTETDELDYKLETAWVSTRDRYRLNGRGEYDKANNEKTADNWLITGKWDYFLTDPNYWGLLAQAEHDEFQDLDLRALAGPYYGRQFFDEPVFTLSGELGVSYVDENFNVAEDQDYGAMNWSLDIKSDYLGGDSRLYLQQFGLWNLEETSDAVINTTLGLAFPLLFDFEAAAEILWEYDSGAVDDVDELDETYSIRIGYTW